LLLLPLLLMILRWRTYHCQMLKHLRAVTALLQRSGGQQAARA